MNLRIRPTGSTDGGFNVIEVLAQAGGATVVTDGMVLCNSARSIEYKLSSTATVADLTIRGWHIGGWLLS